jgi:hypothetical protein
LCPDVLVQVQGSRYGSVGETVNVAGLKLAGLSKGTLGGSNPSPTLGKEGRLLVFKPGDKVVVSSEWKANWPGLRAGEKLTIAAKPDGDDTYEVLREVKPCYFARKRVHKDWLISPLDVAYTTFVKRMQVRHAQGRDVFGDRAYHSGLTESLSQALEELEDLANYAAYTHAKVARLIEDIEAAAKKEQG